MPPKQTASQRVVRLVALRGLSPATRLQRQAQRGVARQASRALVRSTTCFHWLPQRLRKRQGRRRPQCPSVLVSLDRQDVVFTEYVAMPPAHDDLPRHALVQSWERDTVTTAPDYVDGEP